VREHTRTRDVGRAERVLPGVWRLRLPLNLPGVPHCNAWALEAGDGIVLVDTGIHETGSMANLERALGQTGRQIEDVRLVVVTHGHPDHCGQAPPIAERAGCEVWIHPRWRLHAPGTTGPDERLERSVEVALQSGAPEGPLRRWAEERRGAGAVQAGTLRSDRDLVPGVEVATDAGTWQVLETPGHAPSHVCLHLPERRLLVSGDHLLGRVSLYFDVGFTLDPVGEFLDSLDVVERLDARLSLAGHARPFTDVAGHIAANRELVARRVDAVRATLAAGRRTAYEVAREVYGDRFTEDMASWLLNKTRAWLEHLQALGEVVRTPAEGEDPVERWALAS
jgi:glyoxylase-like metal-dependent hydrolase (beta-lactamase superfamily II)